MLLKRISTLTGQIHYREMPVTYEQLMAWHEGALIQNVMPNLTADQREFIMTGITRSEWDHVMSDEEPIVDTRCGTCLLDLIDCECH